VDGARSENRLVALVDDAEGRDHPWLERAGDPYFRRVGPVAELVDANRDARALLWDGTSAPRRGAGDAEGDEQQSGARHAPGLGTEAPRDGRRPRRLRIGQQAVVRLRVVAALVRLLLFHEPPGEGGQLLIRLPAGPRQPREVPLHPPRVRLGEIEVRLLVPQDATALDGVVQHDLLDPRLPGAERGDGAELERGTVASPGVVECVRRPR